MSRTGSLYDLTDDELAEIASQAFAHAARATRTAGMSASNAPSSVTPAPRAGRKSAARQPVTTTQRRLKTAVRGA